MLLPLQSAALLLLKYRYILLYPISVAEGPIISVIAGFLVSIGKINFALAYLVLILGDLTGDTILYSLGRWGSGSFLPKYGRYIGITPARIEEGAKIFNKHPVGTLLFGKWSHTFGIVILAAAGITKQKFGRFLLVNLLGTIPKSLFLLLIGYYFGQAYLKINTYINEAIYISIAAAVIGVGGYFIISKFAKRKLS